MSNDWEKDLDAFLDKVPGLPTEPTQQRPRPDNSELDVTQMLMQRLMQQGSPQTNSAPVPAISPDRVEIREGTVYYTSVPAQMSNFPVAMRAGAIENTVGKEFVFKGYKDVLLIENHQPIDLSKVDQTHLKRMCLVEGMWTGVIVVPESAIVKTGQNSGSKILKG